MSQALTQDELKTLVGRAALEHVPAGSVVGVGTGSTVDKFIDALGEALKADPKRVSGAVSSSVRSTQRLKALGVPVLASESVTGLGVYVDGADEIDHAGNMIKGGGAALTREKIVAELAERFVCIADESKLVQVLGKFPLPVEVIPMAAAQVIRAFAAIGGQGQVREGVTTDNGNIIVDVRGLQITDPARFESDVNQWPGVVTVGVFARNKANVCLLGTTAGVKTISY
ncbi:MULTISPECIES: ribose-5-phosphate isomerase RpiA [Aquabacterium]|jgi:ribose 5-phosphate isomerase A|uniref:ribose-5-phosphate isomerase RpiA n=1 Tax=Aquabacterium TaxID=92793 RepID=UPI000718F1A3|nr:MULTISPECIES: ribose-5-phosphate isomerase RpiA [Aquabacterium]MBU0917332.1 ribose-5-phosphate isomerase RpiA [Gammaproteobacteria bacterium]